MGQHDECNSCYEDFDKSELFQPCGGCLALDGRRCLGVSHRRKDTGQIDVNTLTNKIGLDVKEVVTAELKQVVIEKLKPMMMAELKRMMEDIEERSRNKSDAMKISGSRTDHGLDIYNSLEENSFVQYATIVEEGPTTIPLDIIELANQIYDQMPRPHESHLVSLYTSYLMEVVSEVSRDLRLVNSEQFKWIHSVSGYGRSNLKPDLVSAYHPLIEFKSAYKNAPSCKVDRLFGKFASWESRESIHCIWVAKWKIDMRGFGDMCKYLQISGQDKMDHNGVSVRLKGVLFDVNEFWMIRSSGNTIVSVVKCLWSENGSRQCLVEFLRSFDPWMVATNAICDVLNETVIDFSTTSPQLKSEVSAWVGSGANGRVFKLLSGNVIKVVVGKSSEDVEKEYAIMVECLSKEEVKDFIFPIVVGSYCSGIIDGVKYAGYALAREGVQILPPVAPNIKIKLAEALYGLHANKIIHGDPRIQNALLLNGDVKWIDFRETSLITTKLDRMRDVKVLFKSLGGKVSDAREQITLYSDFPSLENLCAVISS